MLAPIVLFAYNRPWHTRRTVEALQKNVLAEECDLFVFSDAPKKPEATTSVNETRSYVRTLSGFRSVNIVEREQNLGLANSIISGVTEVFSKYDRVIVLEDDLLTAPCFLTFMNKALDRYPCEQSIFSVSGFNFTIGRPARYPFDAFLSYRSMSWGWGTWKDRWERADWDVKDYPSFQVDPNIRKKLNRGGEDLSEMLALQMKGKLDSWSIRWDYVHSKHDAMALMPIKSMVFNIGFDGSGVHCGTDNIGQSALDTSRNCDYAFPPANHVEPFFIEKIQALHKIRTLRKLKSFFKKFRRASNA